MTFLNPTALLGTLLALPIVVFYLLKTRPRRVPVSTVMFWQQVFEEKKTRTLWRQLRHLVSLLLQLLWLSLLLVAVADPVFTSQARQPRRVVLVIDTSASMQATESDGRTRMDAAKEVMSDLIASLRAADEMAIVAAHSSPTVVSGLTSHPPTLTRLTESIRTTDGAADVPAAIRVAQRLLAKHPNGEVIVVSDGCFPQATKLAADPGVKWSQVGSTLGNVGITQFQVRRNVSDPLSYQTLIEIRNMNDNAAECSVEIQLNGRLLDVLPLSLEPKEVWHRVLEQTSAEGGVLTAKLDITESSADGLVSAQSTTLNALAADDEASAVLPARKSIPVTLVTDGNWFLQRVLEANSVVDLTLTDEPPQSLPSDRILILHGNVPDVIPAGHVIVIQPNSSTDLWQRNSTIDEPLIGQQDDASELLRHVRLDNVLLPQVSKILPRGEHQALIETVSGAPLYVRFPREGGDVLVLTIDLEKSDLPLRTAFPILLSNALSFLSGHSGDMMEAITAGQSTTISLPPALLRSDGNTTTNLSLIAPDGSQRVIRAAASNELVLTLDQAGVWKLQAENLQPADSAAEDSAHSQELLLACNVADAQESDLQLATVVSTTTEASAAGPAGRPAWMYLTLAAALFAVVEWGLFHRRWIA